MLLRAWKSSKLRFALVGAAGFLVDTAIVLLLLGAGWRPAVARCAAFGVAVLVTWLLNRSFSFQASKLGHVGKEGGAYFLVQLGGFAANLLVFTSLLNLTRPWSYPLLALMLAAAVGMTVNYTGARVFIYKERAG